MIFTRIFICHDLDLTEEIQPEVLLLKQLCQRLQAASVDVLIYSGRASDDEFLAFFYQHLSSCQWFLLFQTPGALQSFGVRSAVSVARTRVEQKQMQGIARFLAQPGETPNIPSTWTTIPAFGATGNLQRDIEKLLTSLPLSREKIVQKRIASTPPTPGENEAQENLPITPYEQLPLYEQPLVVSLKPRSGLTTPPPEPDSNAELWSTYPPATDTLKPLNSTGQQAKKSATHRSRWFFAALAAALILSISLSAALFSLHHNAELAQNASALLAQRTFAIQKTATARVQGTVSARTAATAQAQSKATASAQATVNASLDLYMATTGKVPHVTDPLTSPSTLKWDVLTYIGGGSCAYTNGSYRASMPQKGFFASCRAEAANYHNFLYRVYMTISGGTAHDGGGLLFRGQTNNAYRLRINVNGSYELVTATKTLASGTSSAIKTGLGQTNLVAVAALDNRIDIYVNGQVITTLTDTTLTTGNLGLMAINSSGNTVNVSYSDAQIWLL